MAARRLEPAPLAALLLLLSACESDPAGAPSPDAPDDVDAAADVPDADDAGETTDAHTTPPLPDLLEAPNNIALDARLAVSGTRAEALWPREALWGIATIRDDSAATAWQAPRNEPAWICLDVQPIAGRPLRLDSVRVEVTGLEGDVGVELGRFCGDGAGQQVGRIQAGNALALETATAGAVTLRFGAAADLRVATIELLTRDPLPPGPPRSRPVNARTFADSGVIEGFYGVPWSWRERNAMVDLLAAAAMGTYIYAPKDDLLHRNLWRDPYGDDFLTPFAAFVAYAESRGVDVVYAIAPFRDWRGGSDLPVLISKLGTLYDHGVRHFAVLADDIEFDLDNPIDGDLGAQHAEVTNAALAALRERNGNVSMWFVGTVYHDRQRAEWTGGESYLGALAALEEDVRVLWTGRDVSVGTMTADDMVAVTAQVGRAPHIWDNLWANDGGDGFTGRLLLRPFSGRDAGLLAAVGGIAHNPLIQGATARINLAGFGAWLLDPTIAPEAALQAGIADGTADSRTPVRDASLLAFVAAIYDGDAATDASAEMFVADVRELGTRLGRGDAGGDALARVAATFGRMAAVQSELWHSGLGADLVDELHWPLERIRLDGQAGLAWLRARTAAHLGTGDQQSAWAELDSLRAELSTARFRYGPALVELLEDSYRAAGAAPAPELVPVALALDPQAPCVVGEPLQLVIRPEESATVTTHGLPGATVDAGNVVSFVPPHAGIYAGWAVAADSAGSRFGVTPLVVACAAE